MQPSDEIKSRLDIVELIRGYVPVKAAGANFRARCPFHREKTPSLMISPEKQIWHCFGCGKGGDIFSFVMEIEGVGFVDALRILAPKAGVTLRRQDPKLASERNRLLDIVEISGKYYHNYLKTSKQSANARAYLKKRGLTEETIDEWKIGYSPDSWDALLKFLKTKGYKENEIFLAGMIVKSDKGRGYYDRFRARITFPINDINGNIVAFSARVSAEKEAEEKMGKYINSPGTKIYDKSRILFGLDKAKMEIKNNDLAIIVEGQMDAISAHQHGYKNVIASSGTALTGDQILLLKRYSQDIALAFDMDTAGMMAADRGIQEAWRAEMNVKVIELPEGKDPDECIRKNPSLWEQAVAAAKPMMQYYFDLAFNNLDLSNVDNRRQAAKKLLPLIAKLGNNIDKDFWLKRLSQKIDVREDFLREALSANAGAKRPKQAPSDFKRENVEKEVKVASSREEKLSELILSLVLKFPELLEFIVSHLQSEHIVGQANQLLYKNLIFYYNNIVNDKAAISNLADTKKNILNFNFNEFRQWLLEEADSPILTNKANSQLTVLEKLVFLGDKEYYDLNISLAKEEASKISLILKKNYLLNKQKELAKMISEAENSEDNIKANDLMKELKILSDEIKEFL